MSAALRCGGKACPSCPYLKATPLGVWHAEEYARLAVYDEETHVQAIEGVGLFGCHRDDGTLCRGWVRVHGEDAFAMRMALAQGAVDAAEMRTACEGQETYATAAEVISANAEHAAKPVQGKAATMVRKLMEKKGRGEA